MKTQKNTQAKTPHGGLLRTFFTLAACSALLLPQVASAQSEELYDPGSDELSPAPIMVAKAKGNVRATTSLNASPFAVKDGAKLLQGTTITTGQDSAVNLLFSNGTAIALGPNTTLVVTEFLQAGGYDLAEEIEDTSGTPPPPSGGKKIADLEKEPTWSSTKLFFAEGSITTKTKKLDRKSQFLVGSPLGVTKVRGTTFRQTNTSNPETLTKTVSVELQEGDIEFNPVNTPDQTNPPITIRPGQQLVLTGIFTSVADMNAASTITTVQVNIVVNFNMNVSFQTSQLNDPNFLAAIQQALPEGEMQNFSLVGLEMSDQGTLDTSPFFSGDQGVGNVGSFGFGGAGGGSGSGGTSGDGGTPETPGDPIVPGPTPTPTPAPPAPTPVPPPPTPPPPT